MVLEWVRTLALIAPLSEVLATARLATVGLVAAGQAKMKAVTAEELLKRNSSQDLKCFQRNNYCVYMYNRVQ
jgi:hypothetical protein